MMMLTHAAVAGGVGEFIENPWIAFLVGIVLHLIMDKIPHTYVRERMSNSLLKNIDPLLTIVFMIILFFVPTNHLPGLIAGAAGGISVDVYLLGIRKNKGKIATWHFKRQIHKSELSWVTSDLVVFIFGVILIWIFK